MKKIIISITVAAITLCSAAAAADTAEEFIERSKKLREGGKLGEAVEVLEKALAKYPENSDVNAYLGFYSGMMAGQTKNYMEAGELANRSFALLDKSVSLNAGNLTARIFRGIIYTNVPPFFNKADTGIEDLEFAVAAFEEDPVKASDNSKLLAYNLLGSAYAGKGEDEKARAAWKKIIELSPGSEAAEEAGVKLEGLESAGGKESEDKRPQPAETGAHGEKELQEALLRAGEAQGSGDYEKAVEILKKAVTINPESSEVYELLGLLVARLAEKGYDDRIAGDTDLRTNLVFESMKYLDKAVELSPEDTDLRLTRGSMGIYFPFFVGKREQSISDLEYVLENAGSDSIRAEAMYLLGIAHQRRGMRYWIDVAVKYPDSDAAEMVYSGMKPDMSRFDPENVEKPCLVVDFVLGFKDELPPQTAVWVEDGEGNYITTMYVSGFSGYVKNSQIVLPIWAERSEFKDIDAVTGASIDVGHHIYTWNLKDSKGKRVPRGEYVVKAEVSHWPSMKYQMAQAAIDIGRKAGKARVEEGDFIPLLEVKYLP